MYRQAAELPVCSTGITLLRKMYVGLYRLYVSRGLPQLVFHCCTAAGTLRGQRMESN